jgi:hypothetical protein
MRCATVASILLAALLAAACGGTTPPADSGSASAAGGTPSIPASVDSAAPGDIPSAEPSAASVPSDSPEASPTDAATIEPTSSDAPSDAPSSATPASGATACQPEGNNPNFWPGIAQSVSWSAYCAMLPKGWSVTTGKYRLANGGWLKITYKGPGGATLALSEGSFCTDGSGCVPSGSEVGDAAFGSMAGRLVATDAGGFAIVVGRGQQPSWLLVTSGVDQATTVAFGAALATVSG